jgi:hypothetical protein
MCLAYRFVAGWQLRQAGSPRRFTHQFTRAGRIPNVSEKVQGRGWSPSLTPAEVAKAWCLIVGGIVAVAFSPKR